MLEILKMISIVILGLGLIVSIIGHIVFNGREKEYMRLVIMIAIPLIYIILK